MVIMATEEFCLRWNNFHTTVLSSFSGLRKEEEFVDVTIACDGKHLKAHKVVLSASSDFFRVLLKDNPCQHPIIILRDASYLDLQAILAFIYQGEVNVSQDRLASLLRTAEALKIKGLADSESDSDLGRSDKEEKEELSYRREPSPEPASPGPPESPSIKRPRMDHNRSSSRGAVMNTPVKNEPTEDDYQVVEIDQDLDHDEDTNHDSKLPLNPDTSASLRFFEQEERLPDSESFGDHSGLGSSSQNDHQAPGSGSNQGSESSLECILCRRWTSSIPLLKRHIWEEHSTGTPFRIVCEVLRNIEQYQRQQHK